MQQNPKIDGRYVVLDVLGEGGMARVFLAHDEVLERDVALKVLLERYAEDEEFVERFRREAVNAAALSHPNIVQVFDRGEAPDGRCYISMEYVPGGTLKDRIVRRGPLPPDVAAEVAGQVAEALSVAHDRGVVHRDVKPQNVLVTASGDVKVADFGIARAASETSRTSAVLGTARYMSPEQAAGKPATPASDLYSLGVVLYEMLTGHTPPEKVGRRPEAGIPEGMGALVFKLLAEDPEERYASARDLIADLERVREGLPPAATRGEAKRNDAPATFSGPVMRGGRRGRRRLTFALAALALVVLLGALGWGTLGGSGNIVGTLKGAPDRAREVLGGPVNAVAGKVERAASSQTTVPEVRGLTESAARDRGAAASLGAVVRPRQSAAEQAGRVLEQSAPAGERVRKGSRLLLAVGTGPQNVRRAAQRTARKVVVVPDLVGSSYPEAKSALEKAGLTLGGVNEVSSDPAAAGKVLDQSPRAGTAADPGSPVFLTVGSGGGTGPAASGIPYGGQGGTTTFAGTVPAAQQATTSPQTTSAPLTTTPPQTTSSSPQEATSSPMQTTSLGRSVPSTQPTMPSTQGSGSTGAAAGQYR